MIVRIMDEGQFDVPEQTRPALDKLDSALADSVDSGDDTAFRHALRELLAEVRSAGALLPPDHLGPSELVLPHEGASREEVSTLLSGRQEIPG